MWNKTEVGGLFSVCGVKSLSTIIQIRFFFRVSANFICEREFQARLTVKMPSVKNYTSRVSHAYLLDTIRTFAVLLANKTNNTICLLNSSGHLIVCFSHHCRNEFCSFFIYPHEQVQLFQLCKQCFGFVLMVVVVEVVISVAVEVPVVGHVVMVVFDWNQISLKSKK